MTEKKEPVTATQGKYTQHELFAMLNDHCDDSGVPPRFSNRDARDGERSLYHGYFKNIYGEQWVFVYDYAKEAGKLYGGDIDWKKPVDVVEVDGAKIQQRLEKKAAAEGLGAEAVQAALNGAGRLKNGNLLCVLGKDGPILLNSQERDWLKVLWETVQYNRTQRDKRRNPASTAQEQP